MSRGLGSVSLMCPFQLKIFYDSTIVPSSFTVSIPKSGKPQTPSVIKTFKALDTATLLKRESNSRLNEDPNNYC